MADWDGTRWVPEPPAMPPRRRSPAHRVLAAAAEASLIALLVLGTVTGTALAAKGGGKAGSGTIAGPIVLQDANGNGTANAWDGVTFEVATTASDRPFVGLRCWQGPVWVFDGYAGYFPESLFDQWFVLGSDSWQAGADATCTARLFYYDRRGNQKVLATLDFAVQP
jgi:H+/gluconate symporter-like permease